MTDAISRSNLIKLCHNLVCGTVGPNEIARVPGIDAVPVVRCKDCKHAVPITKPLIAKAFKGEAMACNIWRGSLCVGLSVVNLDGYCSDGARRDGEADE